MASGMAVAPFVGGLLLAHFWWGSVFLASVPVMAVTIAVVPRLVPESRADTPPPLEHAYASQSVSSSARSTPELVQAPQYALGGGALHPSSKVSQSPELSYASVPGAGHWQDGARYNPVKVDSGFYEERDQPASPASSSGSQYGAQSQPVSPTTPYAYGQYSSHHGASQSGLSKYESSPSEWRR